ncbi:MAG: hypothetical protein AB7O59_07175 [Pirellulales bacterium]
MDGYTESTNVASDCPPSEAWLFAQAVLGRPIPRIASPEAKAEAGRAELKRLAEFSSRHAQELRDLQAAEAEGRRDRELLEWAAQISTLAEDKLRALRCKKADAHETWRRAEQFCEARLASLTEWNEEDHPRAPKGTSIGGQWISKDGGAGGTSIGVGRSSKERRPGEEGEPSPHMLELARTWWQTKDALEQARRDIEELPHRIANEREQLGSGGRYAYIHRQNLAKAQRDLEAAKAIVPELEKQLGELEQEYHDSGYSDVVYSAWTPGETLTGGRGIADVGRAVAMSGTPAGLQPTGIEVDIAAAALGGPAILRLGRAILNRAIRKTPVPILRRASFGHAPSTNYRRTFFDAHPEHKGKVIVHHSVEQQVLDRYPGVVTESELHSLENLRGIPKGNNSETHLSEIRREWNRFYEQYPNATKEELLDNATEIDGKYGHLFDPPIR